MSLTIPRPILLLVAVFAGGTYSTSSPDGVCHEDSSLLTLKTLRKERVDSSDAGTLRAAVCSGGPCPLAHLGEGTSTVHVDVRDLCNQKDPGGHHYFCNYKLAGGCRQICGEDLLSLTDLQAYIDSILSRNPFLGSDGEEMDPWVVPQMNLEVNDSYVFMTQRMALYLSLRTLGLKIASPKDSVVSKGTSGNALEYGFTSGCNLYGTFSRACHMSAMDGGVPTAGLQGNIFGLLSWAARLALENGACYKTQESDSSSHCSHDAVIGAVHGGKTGPEAKKALEAALESDLTELQDSGTRPNVCHFDESEWVWTNSKDKGKSDQDKYCKGHRETPQVHEAGVADFMSVDRPGTLAVDIAGAAYGSSPGPASGELFSTQDESTPVFYPETAALSFNSPARRLFTGPTSLLFLGVRRYFSGQSGSHGIGTLSDIRYPLAVFGQKCGNLNYSSLSDFTMLTDTVTTEVAGMPVKMFPHSLGTITSSCGTCFGHNYPTTKDKYHTGGPTCFIEWRNGQSVCKEDDPAKTDWTQFLDVWIWVGALKPDFYPPATSKAIQDLVTRVGTGPWGAGVWWGNTLQYFVVVWLANALLWEGGAGPQLDYYAYGAPGQDGYPLGGFCEQYRAEGYYDVVQNLKQLDDALEARRQKNEPFTLGHFYQYLKACSNCQEDCTFIKGMFFNKNNIYCTSKCTEQFLSCLLPKISGA